MVRRLQQRPGNSGWIDNLLMFSVELVGPVASWPVVGSHSISLPLRVPSHHLIREEPG
jgi:hypothetical protein